MMCTTDPGSMLWLRRWGKSMGGVLALILFFSSGPGSVRAAEKAEITKALTQGDGRVEASLKTLSEKVARHPGDLLAWRDLGVSQVRAKRYESALRSFERAAAEHASDPYLVGYRAVALEMQQRLSDAAAGYRRLAALLPEDAASLEARATVVELRARLAPKSSADDLKGRERVLALLGPVDLGNNATQFGEDLVAGLEMGLAGVDRFTVLDPQRTAQWLAAEERSIADLDDPEGRRLAGRALFRRGVSAVLSSSFLKTESDEVHLRVAVLPVQEDGFAEARSLTVEPAPQGEELRSLPAVIEGICKEMGAVAPHDLAERLPRSEAAMTAFLAGRRALLEGELRSAATGLEAAAREAPHVTSFQRWGQELQRLSDHLDDDLVVHVGEAAPVVEFLRDRAKREDRRKRRFDEES